MMSSPWVWFWSALIFASIAWYAWLLFQVGWRGGHDIVRMAKALSEQQQAEQD